MSSIYGESIKLSIFGQSHGPAVGMTLDGIPAGLPVDLNVLQTFLLRRAPGQNPLSTTRKEADLPEFLAGIVDGFTCGSPITAIIPNTSAKSTDYASIRDIPRPGHADLTAQFKYKGFQDHSGGGHFSGRLTAPLCIAGGLCKQWLDAMGISVNAHIVSIGNITDSPAHLDPVQPDLSTLDTDFPVISVDAKRNMQSAILSAQSEGDSLGGQIECVITGLPVGMGEPMFGGMESRLAQILFGIPAIKGVSFGSGFDACVMRGSTHNDPIGIKDGRIISATNHAGGILGGITNGMPLVFQVAVKPTPSISMPQRSISLETMEEKTIVIEGRHDPCIVPRVAPVIEAAAAIAIYDAYLSMKQG